MFTFVIYCLTTSNSSWFMDLIFQVPMQYCSLQLQTLLALPDTSTTEHCFCFGLAASFLLQLLVLAHCSSLVAYWTCSNLSQKDGSSSDVIFFCLFILFMGLLWKECWSGLPFPPHVYYFLSEFSTMTCPSWVAPQHGS